MSAPAKAVATTPDRAIVITRTLDAQRESPARRSIVPRCGMRRSRRTLAPRSAG